MRIFKKKCRFCGIEFETTSRTQRYCENCRFKNRKTPKKELKELNCPVCGLLFAQKNSNQKYCSSYCREYANRKNTDGYLDTYNMRSYAAYQQSRLAKCVKIAKDAGMTYGEAERAGLFEDVK